MPQRLTRRIVLRPNPAGRRAGLPVGLPLGAAARLALAVVAALSILLFSETDAFAKPRGAFVVFDAETGRVLRSVRAEDRRHPASLTKMMTLYLVYEALEDRKLTLNQRLKTSRHAASMPAMELGLRRGQHVTVRDAIRASAVHSANDAAVVLAEAVGGTESNFARMMTAKARELGMYETTFKNATGFTAKGHLSTARDMAILARRLWLDFPQYYSVYKRTSVKVGRRTYRATNGLLGEPGVDGIKTGFTRAAGYNLAASAARKGRRVTVVLMGGRTRDGRNRAVLSLINDGFKKLKRRPKRDAAGPLISSYRAAPAPRLSPRRRVADAPTSPVLAQLAARKRSHEARAGSTWAVQLGAFFRRSEARDMMRTLVAKNAPGLESGYRAIETGRVENSRGAVVTVHRVRFTGLDETSARLACRHLRRNRQPCALVPPEGWGS
ncbi:MAG: D-alanyl-D-alanine carboxypeptidase [Pseudomonadota bacterium]